MQSKIIKNTAVFVVAIFVSSLFLTRSASTYPIYEQRKKDTPFGEITATRSLVTQLPITRETKIDQVSIYMATYARSNTCAVDFYIYKNEEVVYFHKVKDASIMQDNKYYDLEGIDLFCTPEDEVYLVITSPDGASGNAVTAYMLKEEDGPQVNVCDLGSGVTTEYDGALMFSIYENRPILDTLYRSYPYFGWVAIPVLGILIGLIVLLANELLPLEELRRKKP